MTGTFHWFAFRSAASGRLYGRGDFWDRDGGMYRGGLENRLCRLEAPPTTWIAIGKSLKVRIGTSETDERLLGAAEGSAFPRIERPALVDLDHPLDIGSALDDAAAVSEHRHNVRVLIRALWSCPHDAAARRSTSRIQLALER